MFLKRLDTCCLYLYGYWGAKMQLKNKNHRKLFGKWCMQTSQICTRLIFFLRYKVHRYCEGVTHKKTYLIFISDSLTQRKFKSWCCVVWYTFQREDRDCSISLTENFLSIPADDRSLDLYWHTLLIRSCIQWST